MIERALEPHDSVTELATVVRRASPDDFPALLVMGELLVTEANTGPLIRATFDRSRLLASLHAIHEHGVIFVAERNRAPVGALVAMLEPGLGWTEIAATELGLFTAPGHRGVGVARELVAALIGWAKERGACWVQIGDGLGVSPGAMFSVAQSFGFLHAGVAYKLALP